MLFLGKSLTWGAMEVILWRLFCTGTILDNFVQMSVLEKKLALLLNLFYISGARSHVHQSIFGLDGLHNGCNIYSGLDFGSCYKSLRFSFDLDLVNLLKNG